MKKLMIISDLWGIKQSQWWQYYTDNLDSFDVVFYDACALAQIDMRDYREEALHRQFVNGGIDTAVENLLKMQKPSDVVLGFSVGGYIAFKALQSGLQAQQLFAMSATRLRKEKTCLNVPTTLFYGENDAYKPTAAWFTQMHITPHIFQGENHDCYQKEQIAEQLCQLIKLYHGDLPNT